MSYRGPGPALLDAGDVAAPLLPPRKPREQRPPSSLKWPTKAEMKKFSEMAKARHEVQTEYARLVDEGLWEQAKTTDPDFVAGVEAGIKRGTLNEVKPRNNGMGVVRKSDDQPVLADDEQFADDPVAGFLQRPLAYMNRATGQVDATARVAGRTGKGGYTFGQQANKAVAPGAAALSAVGLASPYLAPLGPWGLIPAGIIGLGAGYLANQAQNKTDEVILGEGPAKQLAASEGHGAAQNPLHAIAGQFAGQLISARVSIPDLKLVASLFRGQLAKGTPEYARAVTTAIASGGGAGFGTAQDIVRQVDAIQSGQQEGYDLWPTIVSAASGAIPTQSNFGKQPKLPAAKPAAKTVDATAKPLPAVSRKPQPTDVPPRMVPPGPKAPGREVAGPKPVEQPIAPAPQTRTAPVETPKVETPTPPTTDALEVHAQALARKYAHGDEVPSSAVIAKRLGISREEALKVKERAVAIRQTPRAKPATSRGRANIPVMPETPPVAEAPPPSPPKAVEATPVVEQTKPIEVAPAKPEPVAAETKTGVDAAQAYVDSLKEMPNKLRGPKPFAQRYLDWKKGGMVGERPSAGEEAISPRSVRVVEKAIDAHMGETPKPSTAPATKPAGGKKPLPPAKSVEERRRGSESGMVGARPGPKKSTKTVEEEVDFGVPGYPRLKKVSINPSVVEVDKTWTMKSKTPIIRFRPESGYRDVRESRSIGDENPGYAWRAMSGDEYDEAVRTGVIQSKGAANEENFQTRDSSGITAYNTDGPSPMYIKDSFALANRPQKKGYVVAVPIGELSISDRPNTAEVQTRTPARLSENVKVYEVDEVGRWHGDDKLPNQTLTGEPIYGIREIANPKAKPRAKSMDERRRGGEGGMFGGPVKKNRSSKGPASDKNAAAIDNGKEPSALSRIISNLLPGGEYRPSVIAVGKQGIRSDAAIATEAANVAAGRLGKSTNEKKFAAQGGLDPSERVEENIRRTRQVRDITDDVLQNGPRDKKDKQIGPGLTGAFKPIVEDARIGGKKLSQPEIQDHYQASVEDAVARRVVSRGEHIDKQATAEYDDAVDAVLDAEGKARNKAQRDAAAKMRAELPTIKAEVDARAVEQKNNIIGYKDKAAGETDVDVATRALKEYEAAYPDTIKNIRQVGDNMQTFARDVLKYAVAHGRISQEEFDKIAGSEDFYTPLKQLIDREMGAGLNPSSGSVKPLGKAAAVAKRFYYGDKEGIVENPFAEIVSQTERIVREVERNKVFQSFYNLASNPKGNVGDIVEVVPGNKIPRRDGVPDKEAMKRDGIVTVYVDGKAKYLKFSTKERFGQSLAKIMVNMNSRDNTAMKIANFLTGVQKRLITLHPGFAATQYVRDRLDRFVLSQHIDPLKEVSRNLTKPDEAQLSRERRFPMGQTALQVSDENANYKEILENVLDKGGVQKRDGMYRVKAAKRAYEHVLSMGERQNRRAEFRAAEAYAKSKGLDDYEAGLYASSQATKLQDFTDKGTIARYVLDPLIPFYSASVEGLSRGAAAWRRDPVGTGIKSALVGAIPAYVLMKEREKNGTIRDLFEFPMYQRATGFIPDTRPDMNNTVPWIPKPHAVALLSAAIEHSYAWSWADRGIENEEERAAFKKRVEKSAKETLTMIGSPADMDAIYSSGPVGTAAQLFYNTNVFGDKPIIPPDEKAVPASQRPGREGKSPLVANPTKAINDRLPEDKWQDARFVEFALEKFLGRWMTQAENISRIMDPEEKRKELEVQSALRKIFPMIKDEPAGFSTSVLEMEKGIAETTPVNPTLAQRMIASEFGQAEPKKLAKQRLYQKKQAIYEATTNAGVSTAARNLRGYANSRFTDNLTKMSQKPMLPAKKGDVVPTYREQRRAKSLPPAKKKP